MLMRRMAILPNEAAVMMMMRKKNKWVMGLTMLWLFWMMLRSEAT